MKLIIGLGNPGEKYEKTRHNAGFLVLDELKTRISNEMSNFELSKKFKSEIFQDGDLILTKPQTFMNNSGIAVSSLASYFKIHSSDLFVIHDDLDIKLGEYKIQKGKGPREHNGLMSIYEKLGSKDFWHVRIGIENRAAKVDKAEQVDQVRKLSGQEYVLQKFSGKEHSILDKTIKAVSEELLSKIAG